MRRRANPRFLWAFVWAFPIVAVATILHASATPGSLEAGELAIDGPATERSAISHAAELFPANAFAYMQIRNPSALVEFGQDDRIWNELKQIGDVKRSLESDGFRQFQQVVNLVENRLGASWPEIVDDVTGGGIHLSFDPLQQAVLLVAQAKNAEQMDALSEQVLELHAAGARNNGTPPAEKYEFRGANGWKLNAQAYYCIVDGTFLASNKPVAINLMLDRYHGKAAGSSLADDDSFKAANSAASDRDVWGFARLGPLRIFQEFNKAIAGPSNNPLAELIAGGVLDALGEAQYAVVSADIQDGDIDLHVEMPFEREDVSQRRAWYFSESDAAAQPLLEPPGVILSLSTYRNFSQFWLSRDDLFEEVTLAGLSQADTQLGTFFSGMEFGRDVLGSLEPGLRLVVAQQNFAPGQPEPAAKLPGVAVVVEMKDPDKIFPQLLVAYQTAIGVINITGAMNGQPKLQMGMQEHNDAQVWTGTYLPDPNTDVEAAPIVFNASPSCVRVGDHFVFSSTTELAKQLVDELQKTTAPTSDNSRLLTNFDVLSDVLEENKAALVAQNMLQEGSTQEEADEQISLIIRFLRRIDPASIQFAANNDKLTLDVSFGLRD